MLDGIIALNLFIGMPPQLGLTTLALEKSVAFFRFQLDDTGANVGAAYSTRGCHRSPWHPRGQEMSGAEQSGFVRVAAYKLEIDIDLGLQQKAGLATASSPILLPLNPPRDETFRIAPALETHKAAYDQSELLRKVFMAFAQSPRLRVRRLSAGRRASSCRSPRSVYRQGVLITANGLRHLSTISQNASLLALSPRNPSSSSTSRL